MARRRLAAGLTLVWAVLGAGTAQAAAPTPAATVPPTFTPSPTPIPTARPLRPTRTPRPTATARTRPTATPTAAPETAPRPSATPRRHTHHTHHTRRRSTHTHKHHAKARATPTATPRPTATRVPGVTLSTEDSIAPVTCHRHKYAAAKPFLSSPYRGWTAIVSYFDHDLPDFSVDGNVTIANGVTAAPGSVGESPGFPAYWNGTIRQYVYYDGHNGYDYDLWYQPVYAAAAGRVIFAAYEYPTAPDHGYGQMVMINHGHGYVTLYGHFSRLLVHKGERVSRGQEIGISGNTGHSSGPHLHFTVFHNCTPTDPYGWTGAGADPLQQYQGETSVWLWQRQPLIANPLPHWPGMSALPPGAITRIALVSLPTTSAGAATFAATLTREVDRAASDLRQKGLSAVADPLRGAVVVTGSSTAGEILAAPGVVSITTPDTIEGERGEVLAALARAAAAKPARSVRVARSPHWSGSILRWGGHALLIGRGIPGEQVVVDLQRGRKTLSVRLHAHPGSGAYVADLGPVPARALPRLEQDLAGRGTGGPAVHMHTVATPHRAGTPARLPRPIWPLVLPILLLLGAGGAAGSRVYARTHPHA